MNIITSGLLCLCLGCTLVTPLGTINEDNSVSTPIEEAASVSMIDETGNDLLSVSEEGIQPRLFTTLFVSITSSETEQGTIIGSVKNIFTLFSTTVTVYLYLYSSPTQTDDIAEMTLEASNYIYDLDQGNTIYAVGKTNGQKKYWISFVKYRCNNGDWDFGQSDMVLYNADGTEA